MTSVFGSSQATPTINQNNVDSIATLRAATILGTISTKVKGYYTSGDGGGGDYYLDAADVVSADNGGTIIVDALSQRWKLIPSPVISLMSFGCKTDDGVTDNGPAINLAMNWLGTARPNFPGGMLVIPRGLFGYSTPLVCNWDQIALVGESPRASVLRCYSDLGVSITVEHPTSPGTAFINAFSMSNISLRARVFTSKGSAIKLNKAQLVDIDNVHVEDFFGGVDTYGGGQHQINFLRVFSPRASAPVSWTVPQAGSYYLRFGRAADGSVCSEVQYSQANLRRTETSNFIQNGIIVNACDGLWFNGGHVMGVSNAGCYVNPVTGVEQITNLKFTGFLFDNNSAYGISVVGATTATHGIINLSNCNFFGQSQNAIYVDIGATSFHGFNISGGTVESIAGEGFSLNAGECHVITGMDFSGCNTSGGANLSAVGVSGNTKIQLIGGRISNKYNGSTYAGMLGVRINNASSQNNQVKGVLFDLDASAADITDISTGEFNSFAGCTTTKTSVAGAPSGGSLVIPEIGDAFEVAAGYNFSNLTGRWSERAVTLIFLGASTVTHGVAGIRLSGSANMVAKAGDTLTLTRNSITTSAWYEKSRMVS